jgi:hypothetical protein
MIHTKVWEKLFYKHRRYYYHVARRTCNCFKEATIARMKYSYPPCVRRTTEILYPGIESEQWKGRREIINSYWEVMTEQIKKDHPDWLMEVYLCLS